MKVRTGLYKRSELKQQIKFFTSKKQTYSTKKEQNLYIEKPAFREAEPVFLKGGDKAILLIHGYLGSPYDLKYPAEKLNSAGYTVSVPRLPGHGTTEEDFLKTGKNHWLEEVYKNYRELEKNYSEVIITGFSMGGILAVISAAYFNTKKLILIAPALTNSKRALIIVSPLLKYFIKSIHKNCRIKTNTEYEKYLKKVYWSKDWTRAASDIFFMQIKSVKLLKKLKANILLIVSEKDKTIPVKVSKIIRKKVNKKNMAEKRLSESDHMIFKSREKDKAVSAMLEWLKAQN